MHANVRNGEDSKHRLADPGGPTGLAGPAFRVKYWVCGRGSENMKTMQYGTLNLIFKCKEELVKAVGNLEPSLSRV